MTRSVLISTISVLVFLAGWQLAVTVFQMPNWLLPSPQVVWQAFLHDRAFLTKHALTTVSCALAGLLIGALLGAGLAIVMSRYRMVERILMPLLVIDQSVPKIAVAPLLIIWFGSGPASRIGIAVVISFFPVIISTLRGLRTVDRRLGRLMHMLSASWTQTLLKVRLPNAVPHIFAAVRISVPLAVTGAVVAEYVQSNSGLGFVILLSLTEFNTPRVFAAATLLSVSCLLLYLLVFVAERLILGRRVEVFMKSYSQQ